jgi:hypothetical protein
MDIESFKGCVADGGLEGSFVPEFCQWQPTKPLDWARMVRAAKEGFEALIEMLNLAVCLRVVGGAHHQLCVRQVEQLLLEHAGEDLVAVRHDAPGKTMELVNVVDEELGNLKSGEGMLQWKEMVVLCQFVDYHQDHVMAVGFGQTLDGIQADGAPCCRRHRKRLK